MSWRDVFDELDSALPPESVQEARERRPLRVDEIRAIVAVLDGSGDGTVVWTDRVQIERIWKDVVKTERILSKNTVAALRQMPAEQPWRTVSDAVLTDDGWMAVTDPTTGEIHEIRPDGATRVWRMRAGVAN